MLPPHAMTHHMP